MSSTRPFRWGAACATILTLAAARPAGAQSAVDSLRKSYQLAPLPPGKTVSAGLRPSAGVSISSPTAWGASFGQGFVGVGYQARKRYEQVQDGSIAAGLGLGDPRAYVGLEVAATAVSTVRATPYRYGTLSVKLHRVLPWHSAIAIGADNAVRWDHSTQGASIYGVASKSFRLAGQSDFVASVGVGNGQFRSEQNVIARQETVNAFGSAALRLHPGVSLIADWTGQDLAAGVSLAPFSPLPLVITIAGADLTGRAGDGSRLVVGAGTGIGFGAIRDLVPSLR